MTEIAEADWKRWRTLAPALLDRFCQSVVAEAATFHQSADSGHEQFLALYRFLDAKNEDIRAVFDDRRRSNALFQVTGAWVRGMITAQELSEFSSEFQARVRALAGIGG
jgi:hypothetical protein